MAKIIYVQTDGARHEVETGVETSVMQAAVENGIAGIVGECGGSAMCATCHVYVDPGYVDRIPPITEVEHSMLDSTSSERRENSRLSCQIVIDGSFGELVVHVPSSQQ